MLWLIWGFFRGNNNFVFVNNSYSGADVIDAMQDGNPSFNQNGMMFSTYDVDNDRNASGSCSRSNGNGGWWFNCCRQACLTCNPAMWGTCSITSSQMLIFAIVGV
jgi:Fibrinogen beta and gamma chains, C-terminal globular domain